MASLSIVPQKRPRPVKSCLRCRNKKLKCDREQPCSKCRIHPEEDCVYDERVGSLGDPFHHVERPSYHPTPPSVVSSQRGEIRRSPSSPEQVSKLQARVRRLESLINQTNPQARAHVSNNVANAAAQQNPDDISTPSAAEPELQTFHGLHNTRSLLALFPEAVAFATQSLKDPQMIPEYRNLSRMFPKEKIQGDEYERVNLDSILALLPPKDVSERYASLYTSYLEGPYRILHVPTLRRQCRYFWDRESETDHVFRMNFTPQLVIIVAIGSLLESPDASSVFSPWHARKTAAMIETYLSNLSPKQRIQLETLQTTSILLILKRMLSVPSTEIWRQTGYLLRSAMAGGLHRDSEGVMPELSHLQAELRRRLWHTIMELDIEASILCCMPSLVQVISYTCRLPNGNDDEISPSGEDGSKESGNDTAKDVTFQRSLAKSLPVRLRALRLLTQGRTDQKELHATIHELEGCYKALVPMWSFAVMQDPVQLCHTSILVMCIKRPIISLFTMWLQCRGYADITGLHEPLSLGSILYCKGVLSLSENLDPQKSMYDTVSDDTGWRLFNFFEMDDIIRAMYSVWYCSQVLKTRYLSGEDSDPEDFMELGVVSPETRTRFDDQIKSIVQRFPDLRPILKQLMGLAVIGQMTKYTTSEERKQELMQTGLQNFLQLCRERHNEDKRRRPTRRESDTLSTRSATEFYDLLTPDNFGLDSTLFGWNSEFLFDDGLQATVTMLPEPIT